MKCLIFAAVVFVCFSSCKKSADSGPVTPPDTTAAVHLQYRAADLSFLPEIQQAGTKFYDSTGAKDALAIFKEYGCNLVRVRLWHTPANEHSALPEVLKFCKQISDAGLQILLDFHFSDTWADPSHQSIPAAWSSLSVNLLQDSVKAYTQRVISLLKAQNTLPAIVQSGNEINVGMMWPAGKVNNASDPNWVNFAGLIKSAIAGVKAADTDNKVLIMLHYAQFDGITSFFDNIKTQGVQYDIIGVSYYPWWSTMDLVYVQQQFNNLATTYNKKVFVAETAYPWSLQWNDNTNNVVGLTSQEIPAYPATPQGQLNFLLQLKTMINNIPSKLGIGFSYWAPDWVAFKGTGSTSGSDWENLTLFDFNNKATRGMQAYKQ